ncbi:MAG TPA: DNA polymerase, partial [Microbacteriaceae bacterium]|nr:DNA polymerase [Microbacteriaceae bacterium]
MAGVPTTAPAPIRTIVLWCPDWPITAVSRVRGLAADAPVALIDSSVVFACSGAARRDGVRRGMRVREAQASCPELLVFPYEQAIDIRSFEPVLEAIEETMPGVQLLRAGTCAVRARGPA